MAQLNATENIARKKSGRHRKMANPSIDMTPMVDLGFLLICFFVFTTTMSKPVVTELIVPKEGPPINIKNSGSLTVLSGRENHLYWYEGNWEDALKNNQVMITSYSMINGLGDIIRQKQQRMNQAKGSKDGRNNLMLIIKAGKEASYKNLVDLLDEVLINDVKHYAVVDPTQAENAYLEK